MKNKREFIIAGISLLIGISVTYYFLQSRIPANKQIAQLPLQNEITPTISLNPSLEAAIKLIEQKDYVVFDGSNAWHSPLGLNVLIGACAGAEGYCKQAFFFYNGEYLGTDTSDPSSQINVAWRNNDTIALNYVLYRRDDPTCCPTAGAVTVRFQWDGNKLIALDPIPMLGLSADVHR